MKAIFSQLKQILIALDQLLNTLIGLLLIFISLLSRQYKINSFTGWADETVSARAYRRRQLFIWSMLMHAIDAFFFVFTFEWNHCRSSYESEKQRRQLPPEYR